MNNQYVYIGDYKMVGPVEIDNPEQCQFSYSGAYVAAMGSYTKHIACLPTIEVLKEPKNDWEKYQFLVEGEDFEFKKDWSQETKLYMEAYGDNPKDFPFKPVAVPILNKSESKEGSELFTKSCCTRNVNTQIKEGDCLFTEENIRNAALAVFKSHKYTPTIYPESHIGEKVLARIEKDVRIAFEYLQSIKNNQP